MAASSPIFPHWYQIIEAIFDSPLFEKCGLKESKKHYRDQVKLFKKTFVLPIVEPEKMVQAIDKRSQSTVAVPETSEEIAFQKYTELNSFGNQFTLIGDAHKMEFNRISDNVTDILQLDAPQDFNLFRLCGLDDQFELYHPVDVLHIIRMGEAILQTAGIKGIKLRAFEDTYNIEFRMGFKDPSRFVTVHRQCQLSSPEEGEFGRKHIDIWRITKGHDQFSHVRATFVNKDDHDMNTAARTLFFSTNSMLLNLTPRDVVLSNLLCEYSQKDYYAAFNDKLSEVFGQKFEVPRQYCADIKSNLISKIDNRISENTKGQEFLSDVLSWSFYRKCGQLGILKPPVFLNDIIWGQVRKGAVNQTTT